MKSTLLSLALCLLPLAACSVDKGGLASVDDLPGAGGVGSGGAGGSGGTLAATGGKGGQATGGATATDAAGTAPDSGTADGPAGERPLATGGAGGSDGRVDVRPTGGAGGAGGVVALDGGGGGPGSDGGGDGQSEDARADLGPGTDLARDAADAERRELPREAGPDRGPDLPPTADGPAADAPDPSDSADGVSDASVGPETNGEAGPLALVWNDEFDGAANTGVDTGKWTHVTWPPGTVNDELQQYTSNLRNVFQDGEGHLVIRALRSGQGPNSSYTSGRIETTGKISFGPGHRIEVRAKLPAGIGSFPAILLKGTPGLWPDSGALGLMEQYGQDKSWFYATAYAPETPGSGVTPRTKYSFENATTASADFHVYALDWYDGRLVFQVDGDVALTSEYGPSSPFYSITEYLVLNVAVGGNMGGDVDNAAFPMDMVVDYVRVYQF